MMLENVEEFKTWGPLMADEDRPDPARAGETFAAFVGMLGAGVPADNPALDEVCEFLLIDRHSAAAQRLTDGLGYEVEYRELRACDYGAPTIRKRFFMVMRCDGLPVAWPVQSHGDPKSLPVQSGQLKPWRTAAECIDWSLPCPSIFGRKKPLADNTMKRIARGIQRFVIDNPTPFIVKCNHTSTITKYDCFRGQALSEPLHTITKAPGFAVAIPHLTKFRTGATGQEVTEPLATVTAGTSARPGGNGHALGIVKTYLTPFLAGAGGSEYQAKPRSCDKPAHTIMKESRSCVVAPVIARQFGASVGHAVDQPAGTVTAGGGGKSQLVAANLIKHYGGNYTGPGAPLDGPMHTVTTTDHHALVTSSIIKMRGTNTGQPTDSPLQTVTAGGQHFGEVRTSLAVQDYDEERASLTAEFLHQHDLREFVEIEGVTYRIVDIGMRMLQPKELYAAQGFPAWYVIDQDYRGNKYAKDKQVARCGNAVPPPFAEALVRANLPEMCIKEEKVA
ncbi:DNA cytosine methyltransferase [Erwinia aphidicola]